jgi:hypothetical protein
MVTRIGRFKLELCSENNWKNRESIPIRRKVLNEQLSSLRLPKIIKPSFSLTAKDINYFNKLRANGIYGHKNINLSVENT